MSKVTSPQQRFWPKVQKLESGCWEWQCALTNGYGVFWDGKRQVRAHRFSYEHFYNSSIPDGLTLDHLCRNRKCVNPKHMEIVSKGENVLRGTSLPAQNATKLSCCHGHLFTLVNTYIKDRWRYCRTCRKERARQYRLEERYS